MTQEAPIKRISVTVVALAVVCVILSAGFVGLIVLYGSSNQSNPNQQAIIDQQNEQLANFAANQTGLIQQIAQYQVQIQQYQSQIQNQDQTNYTQAIASLQQDISNYEQIIALQKSASLYSNTLTMNANSATQIFTGTTTYAGYVVVQGNTTSTTTYAQVQYTFGNNIYSYNQTIGLSGSAVLPVLPSSDANSFIVSVGNTDNATTTATVTATFFF